MLGKIISNDGVVEVLKETKEEEQKKKLKEKLEETYLLSLRLK
jgi:predicted house-cleaning noncanonical NTP pyrophosphatase (MazG superfamily)